MPLGLLILLVCQLAGELFVRVLDVTMPGPVVGMVLTAVATAAALPLLLLVL